VSAWAGSIKVVESKIILLQLESREVAWVEISVTIISIGWYHLQCSDYNKGLWDF